MLLAWLSTGFQSLPPTPPTNRLGPSGADSWVGGFLYVLEPVGLSIQLSCLAESFSHHHNTHRFLQPEVLGLSFHCLESWVVQAVSLPSCSSWFICT